MYFKKTQILLISLAFLLCLFLIPTHALLEYALRERLLQRSILSQTQTQQTQHLNQDQLQDQTHTQLRTQHQNQDQLQAQETVYEAPEYKADSGGCAPLVKFEDQVKQGHWYDWESRVPKLSAALAKDSGKLKAVFEGLGDHIWMQYLDGWTHPKGRDSFGDFYVDDMNKAESYLVSQLGKHHWLDVEVYTQIHELAFTKDATRLEKRNGYRRENSGVYLPLPDKPLAVFHDIQLNGKMNFDPKLRTIDTSPAQNKKGRVWKHNSGLLYRWMYVGISEEEGRKIVQGYFDEAWKAIDNAGNDRTVKFKAVVKLYHNLENFHCFIDGNGRTNYLVLQGMLCEIGLHPVLLYNLMESALSSEAEEEERVIEGFLKWESAMETGESSWTIPAIEARSKDCEQAIDELMGQKTTTSFVPDTLTGCMCKDAAACDSNGLFRGKKWCMTDGNCTFTWDYCAPGRKANTA